MSLGGGSPPAPESYGSQVAGELQAKTQYAPQIYGAEATYDPLYANLNLNDLQSFLQGSPGTSQQIPIASQTQGFINSQTGQFVAGSQQPAWSPVLSGFNRNNEAGSANQTDPWSPYTQQGTQMQTVNTPASPGYLSLAGQVNTTANQINAQSQQQQTAGSLANLNQYGAGISAGIQNADPQNAALMNSLTAQAQQGIDAGTNLTPAQMQMVQQNVRQGQAARGMGFGPADQYGEALGVSQFGQQMLQQRIANAQSVAGQRQQFYGGPATAYAMQQPQQYGNPYLQQGYGISSSVGPKLFGSDINAQNAYDTALNAQTSAYNTQQNNSAAVTGAGVSGAAALGAAALMLA